MFVRHRSLQRLDQLLTVNGLQVTYTEAPGGRKRNGLGIHRRRKKCKQCACLEFHPSPSENMCVSPKGPQVCRCGHHVANHVYMKGKSGNTNRLTWKEKMYEATNVTASELLVRSLERSDARRDEHLRLRANVKHKALLTDAIIKGKRKRKKSLGME